MQNIRRPITTAIRQLPRSRTATLKTSSFARVSPFALQRATLSTTTTSPPPTGFPLNLPKWLSENSHLLKPPVNNYCVYNDPMTVMVVGGPNARTDYHINETPEFFYQYKGRMLLKTVQKIKGKDEFVDVYINEGELFLLPANTPHNPVRFADTVGVVIEQPRPESSLDKLRWYCDNCGDVVKEDAFHCTDLGTQIKEAVNRFKADEAARKCKGCGNVIDTAPKPEEMERMRTSPS